MIPIHRRRYRSFRGCVVASSKDKCVLVNLQTQAQLSHSLAQASTDDRFAMAKGTYSRLPENEFKCKLSFVFSPLRSMPWPFREQWICALSVIVRRVPHLRCWGRTWLKLGSCRWLILSLVVSINHRNEREALELSCGLPRAFRLRWLYKEAGRT